MCLVYACHLPLHRRLVLIDEDDKTARANIYRWLPILHPGLQLLQVLRVPTTPEMLQLLLDALPVGKPVGWDLGVVFVRDRLEGGADEEVSWRERLEVGGIVAELSEGSGIETGFYLC